MAKQPTDPVEAAKQELERRKRCDPLLWYAATPSQEKFLRRDVAVDAPFSLVSSQNRGGKSMVACADLALTLRGIHPHKQNYTNLTIMQFTPTRGQAVDVIGKKLFDDSELKLPDGSPKEAYNKPMIPPWEIAELNRPLIAGMRVPVSCTLKNGNKLLFSWSGAADQDKRIAGRRLDAVYIDEEAGTPELFAEVAARLLDARSDKNRPGLGYFVWAYTNTRYNEAYENFMTRAEQGAPGHKTFVLMPGENPAVDTIQREMLAGLMTEDQANIRMRGGVDAGDLVSIYGKQWSDERHILPDPYQIRPEDNLWVCYDPGVDHPMGMGIGAINRDEPLRIRAVKCWNYRGETIERDANNLAEWLAGRKIAGFVYDTNLKNRDRGGGPSVLSRFKELLAARGIIPQAGFYQSKKNHAPGIALFRHYLDPNPDDRTVPPLLVLDPPTPENGVGGLRNQVLKYRGKEATKFTGTGGVVKKDDELIDAFRYLINQRPAYNPTWACGLLVNMSTQRVAQQYADDRIPTQKPIVMDRPRYDFQNRVFLARRRDRATQGAWSMGNV